MDHPFLFTDPLAWYPQSSVGDEALYETAYPNGIKYMEDILSTAFWDSLGDPKASAFFKKARTQLHPLTESLEVQPATANIPRWQLTEYGVTWKGGFNVKNPPANPNVTTAEVEREKDQIRIGFPHTRAFLWNGRPNPRLSILGEKKEGGGDGINRQSKHSQLATCFRDEKTSNESTFWEKFNRESDDDEDVEFGDEEEPANEQLKDSSATQSNGSTF